MVNAFLSEKFWPENVKDLLGQSREGKSCLARTVKTQEYQISIFLITPLLPSFKTAWPDVASSSDASFLWGFLTNQPCQFAATVYLEFGRHIGELPAMMKVSGSVLI